MNLKKLRLCRFRCFGDDEQEIYFNNLTTLIGNNSCGKTTVLQALLKLFSYNSNERNLIRSDFFLPKGVKPDEMQKQDLYIEAVFDFPELDDKNIENKDSIPIFFRHFIVEEPSGKPYLRIRLEASWEKGNNVDGSIESRISYIVCPEEDQIKEEDRKIANRHELDKIRMIYVPAVRDPSKQLRNVSGTMMYQIMKSINWKDDTKESVDKKIEELNEEFEKETGISILKDSIRTQWKNYDSDYRYSNADMRFNNVDMDSMLKGSEVVFSPTVTGRKYCIDEMGDGLRSLFYISLVNSMLEVESVIRKEMNLKSEKRSFNITPPVLTLVAVEEPENHIAPHLIGKLKNKLNDIAEKEDAQTIITSHSPAIVKRIDPEDIRYLRMYPDDLSTKVKIIHFPLEEKYEDRYKYIKEAVQAYPEIYFARLVVLGEGDSEEIVIPKLLELSNGNVDSSGISIVPLGGRFVNHFWRLLKDLDIPFVTLLDLDQERYGGAWGRIKYVLQQLIEVGENRKKLLKCKDGILSKDDFEGMINWTVEKDDKCMLSWIELLENYDVFFSAPLDIDFMMLECFGDTYKSILENNEGPYIKGKEDGKGKISYIEENEIDSAEYKERVEHDVHCTLKENGGDGQSYSKKQKMLMVWYNYFFLNRGKPSTHYLALSKIDDKELMDNAPDVLKRMIKRIEEKLNPTI